jgi:chromate transporter
MGSAPQSSLKELAGLFLRLGFTAFGGPAAHIAMMRQEVVARRKWMTDAEFLDLLAATNLIPGPNSTEMAIHIGLRRGGWRGLLVAGACFILPAVGIVLAIAWFYERYGSLPAMEWVLYGVKPVIIAVIAQALIGLGKSALRSRTTIFAALAAFGLYFINLNEILLLFLAGFFVMGIAQRAQIKLPPLAGLAWLPAGLKVGLDWLALSQYAAGAKGATIGGIFWSFLKIGSVLYGSGYVLLAFLQSEFVERLGWLTESQLLDAVIVGQITPGPVFTTATFIGYLLGGLGGAAAGTVGIFAPAFFFVALSQPFIPRLRANPWLGSFLDGVIAASLGLMAGVAVQLGRSALVDPLTILLAIAAGGLLLRTSINTTWLILGGALIGFVQFLLTTS